MDRTGGKQKLNGDNTSESGPSTIAYQHIKHIHTLQPILPTTTLDEVTISDNKPEALTTNSPHGTQNVDVDKVKLSKCQKKRIKTKNKKVEDTLSGLFSNPEFSH